MITNFLGAQIFISWKIPPLLQDEIVSNLFLSSLHANLICTHLFVVAVVINEMEIAAILHLHGRLWKEPSKAEKGGMTSICVKFSTFQIPQLISRSSRDPPI